VETNVEFNELTADRLPEDDPIEGLKHVGDILNPF